MLLKSHWSKIIFTSFFLVSGFMSSIHFLLLAFAVKTVTEKIWKSVLLIKKFLTLSFEAFDKGFLSVIDFVI